MAENRRLKRKVKRKMRRGCFTSLISAVLVILAMLILFLTPIFNVTEISVAGNGRIGEGVIISVSGIENGSNIFSVDARKAKKRISSLQYVENVKIIKKYPNKIKIEITEGKVSAYIKSGDKAVGINAQGKVLCDINIAGVQAGAPVVKGFNVTKNTMGETVLVEEKNKFDLFLKFLTTFKEKGLLEKLTEFDITDDDYIVFIYEDKLKVEFGDVKRFENKFDYLTAIFDYWAEIPEGIINMTSENYTFRNVALKKN